MKTIALRYSEKFAPEIGTIAAHKQLIESLGYVWYGKLGSPISGKIASEVMANKDPRILLIHSGKIDRYWAHIIGVSRTTPPKEEIPEYYRNMSEKFNFWFKVKYFEEAPKNVMSNCYVASSGNGLSEASKYSMSPYFIIVINEVEID